MSYTNEHSHSQEEKDYLNPPGTRVINTADACISDLTDTIGLNLNDPENYLPLITKFEARKIRQVRITLKPSGEKAIMDYNNVIRLNSEPIEFN